MNEFGHICLRNYKMLTATPAVSPSLHFHGNFSQGLPSQLSQLLKRWEMTSWKPHLFHVKNQDLGSKVSRERSSCRKMQWFCNESFAQTAWCILKPTRCSRICDQGALFGPIEPLRSVQRVCWVELLERPFKNRPSTNRMKQGSLNFRDGPRFQDDAS